MLGGLGKIIPFINNEDEVKEEIKNIFEDSIYKDIFNKHKIRDKNSFLKTVKYIFYCVGNKFSIQKVSNYFKSNEKNNTAHTTIKKYLD
jgi:predicted AAA+ superfamily ATPase